MLRVKAESVPPQTREFHDIEPAITVPALRCAPLDANECRQAGYQLAAHLVEGPLAHHTARRLARAHSTVGRVRQALHHGRGNVREDIEASDGLARVGLVMVRHGLAGVSVPGLALHVAAGNCGEHAALSQVMHGPAMIAGERVHHVRSGSRDHSWTESRMEPGDPGVGDPVVLDAWSPDPAALKRHTVLADNAVTFDAAPPMTPGEARAAWEGAQAEAAALHPESALRSGALLPEAIHLLALQRVALDEFLGQSPSDAGSEPGTMIDPAFVRTLEDQLNRCAADPRGPLGLDVRAVHVARQAYGMNVAAATRQGQPARIIEDAANVGLPLGLIVDGIDGARPPVEHIGRHLAALEVEWATRGAAAGPRPATTEGEG